MFNKKFKSILLGVLILSITLAFSGNIANAAGTNGWKSSGNSWYYYVNGKMKTNAWVQDSFKLWYYMGSNGVMKTNSWVQDSAKTWYFMGSNGAMKTGWVNTGGKWYYMKSNGAMKTGWLSSGGKWYYMNTSGSMVASKWIVSGGKNYYMNAGGDMAVNTKTPDNFFVGADGAWDGKPAGGDDSDDSNSESFNVISIE
ncbi:hypothetical protein SH2C18_22270 [Clostridium sediminicola]|uniref:hypothetical protein n=1 Tax=Clostridium sediminicola TaxID=3114879 RepID=UPI0031F23837